MTQLMDLLLLHADILDYVRSLPAGTPERLVTEKMLRSLVRLPFASQIEDAEKRVPNFAIHRAARQCSGHFTTRRAC